MLPSAAERGPRACMCIHERVKERFISANVHAKSASCRAFALELLHTTLCMCACVPATNGKREAAKRICDRSRQMGVTEVQPFC